MNSEDIEKFFKKKAALNEDLVKITFTDREPACGLFIQDADFQYLKEKNFWRIVPQTHAEAYKKTKNGNLAKLFSGVVFSRLAAYAEGVD